MAKAESVQLRLSLSETVNKLDLVEKELRAKKEFEPKQDEHNTTNIRDDK